GTRSAWEPRSWCHEHRHPDRARPHAARMAPHDRRVGDALRAIPPRCRRDRPEAPARRTRSPSRAGRGRRDFGPPSTSGRQASRPDGRRTARCARRPRAGAALARGRRVWGLARATMKLFRRILVPHDFSEHATRALRLAAELAHAHGGRLVVLHVITPYHPATALAEERVAWYPEPDLITS